LHGRHGSSGENPPTRVRHDPEPADRASIGASEAGLGQAHGDWRHSQAGCGPERGSRRTSLRAAKAATTLLAVTRLQGWMKRNAATALGFSGIDLLRILQTIERHADRQRIPSCKAVAAMYALVTHSPHPVEHVAVAASRTNGQDFTSGSRTLAVTGGKEALISSAVETSSIMSCGVDKGGAGPFARADQAGRSLAG
jgi:hypothetical protein